MAFPKGLKVPADLHRRVALSHARFGHRLRALPKATQSSYDCRALELVPPIKDQKTCGCMPGTDEVLTSEGWKRWDEYDYKTPLGTMSQETGKLEFQTPTERHVYEYDGPLYYSNNRSLDFALTPNHRLYLRKWDEAKRTLEDGYRFTTVEKMGWYAGLPHATSGWAGTDLKRLGVGQRAFSGDDFLALLALVLSDGWAGTAEGVKNTVSFCCFREDRVDMVRALAYRLGIKEQASRPGVWHVIDGDLAHWFKQNAYDGEVYRSPFKRIPQLVKVASQRQIEHFLTFFGDQHIQTCGTRRFYSSSRHMIDDLQELLLRIGKRGTIEERAPRVGGFSNGRRIEGKNPDLTLTERKTERLSLTRKDHLRVDHYKGQVYCATVPNSTLVTRRNGSILVSGNSCWNFSGVGCAEMSAIKAGISTNSNTNWAEQSVLDCGSNGGCDGDWPETALARIKSAGIANTKDYPYTARAGTCKNVAHPNTIADYGYVGASAGVPPVQAIKDALVAYGPLSIAVAADDAFEAYTTGIFLDSGSTDIDHAVMIVAWQDYDATHPAPKGSKSTGYWVVRNQWGTSWGEAGYIRMEYSANQIGYGAMWASSHGAPTPVPVPPGPTPPPPTPTPSGTTLDITLSGTMVGPLGNHAVTMTGTGTPRAAKAAGCGCDEQPGLEASFGPFAAMKVVSDALKIIAAYRAKAGKDVLVADVTQLLADLGITL